MSTLLAKNADVLVTMDPARRELRGAGLYAVDGFIRQVGTTDELPATADVVLDLAGQIVLPGPSRPAPSAGTRSPRDRGRTGNPDPSRGSSTVTHGGTGAPAAQ